jgi:hypothetical protein
MKGGTVTAKGTTGLICDTFTMSGGKLVCPNNDTGIEVWGNDKKTYKMTVSGGTIEITNPSNYGIYGHNCNMSITGGNVVVRQSYGRGISLYSTEYRGVRYGGRLSLTGGTLTASVRDSVQYPLAIDAHAMSNKASCLKYVKGSIYASGATFAVGGSVYKTVSSSSVKLIQGPRPQDGTVIYGGQKYYID